MSHQFSFRPSNHKYLHSSVRDPSAAAVRLPRPPSEGPGRPPTAAKSFQQIGWRRGRQRWQQDLFQPSSEPGVAACSPGSYRYARSLLFLCFCNFKIIFNYLFFFFLLILFFISVFSRQESSLHHQHHRYADLWAGGCNNIQEGDVSSFLWFIHIYLRKPVLCCTLHLI